jgi:SAM-dependent methyltransferase
VNDEPEGGASSFVRIETAKERAWREVSEINGRHSRGEIDDEGWHRAMAELVEPAYLNAKDERGGSGYTGSADAWKQARGLIAEAIDRKGTFLDVGCANGLLLESVVAWCAGRGITIEPYGLDILPSLVAIAKKRLPQWADRFFVGNAIDWQPPMRFNLIRTGLDYVPKPRQQALVEHLLGFADTLIVGTFNEEAEMHKTEDDLRSWGVEIVKTLEREHREPAVRYRVVIVRSARPRTDA